MSEKRNTLYCNFCGKSQHEVKKLVAGPTVFICDECIALCHEIVAGEGIVPLLMGSALLAPLTPETVWDKVTISGSQLLQEAIGIPLAGSPHEKLSARELMAKLVETVGDAIIGECQLQDVRQQIAGAEARLGQLEVDLPRARELVADVDMTQARLARLRKYEADLTDQAERPASA